MIRGLIAALLACFLTNSTAVNAQTTYVSVQRIMTQLAGVDVPVRVFYPTSSEAIKTKFGPWELNISKNAELVAGSYPLIMISHGLGGNDWNHHLLASRLVEAGFMVAAVRHPDDLLRVGEPEHAVLRPLELRSALDTILKNSEFGTSINPTRIGAFGFSAGGYTVLAAAGGRADRNRIIQHCKTPQNDPEFCIGEDGGEPLPLWLRTKRIFYSMPDVQLDQDLFDPRIRAIAVAAPVGLPFHDLNRVVQPTLLIRAENDQTLRYPYHVESIHNLLPEAHTYKTIKGLHHYAFLSPFPEKIASEVGEPAQDPQGFDRREFLRPMNIEIVEFFIKELR